MTIVAQKTIAQKVEAPERFADKLGKHFDDRHRVFLAMIIGEALGIDLEAKDIIGAVAEGEQFHIFYHQIWMGYGFYLCCITSFNKYPSHARSGDWHLLRNWRTCSNGKVLQ
ncbi:MAG: hypothetical protein ACFB2X_15095 [Rivularia sp. (in: cyanobacteria)]